MAYVIAYGSAYAITYVIAYMITYVITYVIAKRYYILYCIRYYIRHYICYCIRCHIRYQICYYVWYCIRYYIRYYVPLCLDCKFRDVSRGAAQNVPKFNSENCPSFSLVLLIIKLWVGETEGSPTGLDKDFGRLNGCKIPLAKVADFAPLGVLSAQMVLEHRISWFTWVHIGISWFSVEDTT